MKNLLIFISPTGSFYYDRLGVVNDATDLVKVQVENSLQLGWKPKNIQLYTNFEYKYGIIKAKVLPDVDFFDKKPQASKINAIIKLFDKGLIKKNELYWFHDFDAFQLHPINESEINIAENCIGVTDYGRVAKWSTGIIYFKSGSKDIFKKIRKVMYDQNIDEEQALGFLTHSNDNIKKRVIKINKSFNFTPYNLKSCYRLAIKPIRVVHFHPHGPIMKLGVKRAIDFFMGENPLHMSLITRDLKKIFMYHRIV